MNSPKHTPTRVPFLGAYFAGFFAHLRAAHRRKVRRRILHLPDPVLSLYEQNAYRILGLDSAATTTRTLLRRRDEIITLLQADIPVAGNLPGYRTVHFPRSAADDVTAVQRAVARLQNEPDRAAEALLWFRLEDEDDATLSGLSAGAFDAVAACWTRSHANGAPPVTRSRCLHNLAVLAHAQALDAERRMATPQALGAPEQWKAALALWAEVLRTPGCWQPFAALGKRSSDPRMREDAMAALRDSLPERILRVNLDLAAAAASQGFHLYARAHLDLVAQCEFPEQAKQRALERFFAEHTDRLRRLLGPFLSPTGTLSDLTDLKKLTQTYRTTRGHLHNLGGESHLCTLAAEALAAARTRLADEFRASSNRFFEADQNCWRKNDALVGIWNVSMNQINQRLFGINYSGRAELLATYAAFKAQATELESLEEQLETLAATAIRIRGIHAFLLELARDAGGDQTSLLKAQRDDFTKTVARAREEYKKTSTHYANMLAAMSRNIGS